MTSTFQATSEVEPDECLGGRAGVCGQGEGGARVRFNFTSGLKCTSDVFLDGRVISYTTSDLRVITLSI